MIEKPYHPYAAEELQQESRNWWHKHPMSYDWHHTNPAAEGTREFFDEIDTRFFNASPLYRGNPPFAKIIPFDTLKGKRVLEIGCGLGSHSQLLAEAGCKLTSIDLTPRAVDLTTKRLKLNHLPADVREMDAEKMDFPDHEFDFVWSWGVIHHSAHTDVIVKQVARVLKPGGEFRCMVYNRKAFDSYVKLVRGFVSGKRFKGMSPADILSYYTDGYVARYYTRASLAELLCSGGLEVTDVYPMGQTSEFFPIPGKGVVGRVKYSLVARMPRDITARALLKTGSFLFGIARKPQGSAS
jgi:2-polyprenyl-3-methyl-5-hydroxy-6-metoxy-1,4-benzoquinol methylase